MINKSQAFLTGTLLAIAAAAPVATAMTTLGTPVDKISFANQVQRWQALDARHLVISVSPRRQFLLTLRSDCAGLRFADHVELSGSRSNTVYAGFDYVRVDGRQCNIETINRVSKDEIKSLRVAFET